MYSPPLAARLSVLAAMAVLFLYMPAAPAAQNDMFTAQDRTDLRYVLKNQASRPDDELDLRDPVNYRFIVRQFERAGYRRADYPQLFASLKGLARRGPKPRLLAANEPGQTEPLNMVVEIKTDDQKSFETQALSSIPGGTTATSLVLGLYDQDDTPIGKVERIDDFAGGKNVILSTTGQFGTPTTEPRLVQSVGSYFYEDQQGAPHSGLLMNASSFYPKKIENQAPLPIKDPNKIVICLNRTVQNQDCDYDCSTGLNCAKQPPSDWQVRFPVKGYIDYYKDIDIDTNTGKPAGASSRIVTTFVQQGGGCKLPFSGFFDDPNTKVVNKNRLEWNLDPAVFGNACYPGKSDITYAFMVSLYTQGTPVSAFINNTGNTPAQSTYKLPTTMKVYQGCLAPGSKVTLADGTERVIEKFDGGESVRSRDATLTVSGTTYGNESKPLVRITAGGASLSMTDEHPVPTQAGIKLARQLKAGDRVYTPTGTARIASVKHEPYRGKVHNLDVGTKADGVELTNENQTFFANGILVGDSEMQNYWQDEIARRELPKSLPKRWLVDFRSAQDFARNSKAH